MEYAVELYFDKVSEEIIKSMWKVLYDKGISEFMYESNSKPHISLAVYNDKLNNFEAFINKVRTLSEDIKSFELNLSNIGMFNTDEGVVFLSPKVTRDLLDIHEKFHDSMKDFSEYEWGYYQPDQWIPHCTMGIDLNQDKLLECIEVISSIFKPIKITVEKIGIIKFKPIQYITEFNL